MKQIKIADIAKVKTPGYYEDVISQGRIQGLFLFMDDTVYLKLKKKYNTTKMGVNKPCCGQKLPSMSEQTKNAIVAVGQAIQGISNGKGLIVSEEIENQRKAICQNCEFLKNERCIKCGCFYKIKVKSPNWSCPVGKWNAL